MLRRAVNVVAIGVLGLLVGAAVAGRPGDVPSDVVSSGLRQVTSTSAPSPATTAAPPASSAPPAPASSTAPATTTTTTTTTTSPPTTTTGPPALVPEGQIRLVVANATDAPGLAARTAAELREIGYLDSVSTDAVASRPDTVIVHAEGFSREAERLAGQIGLDPARIQPRGNEQLTVNDASGDLWLLLGADN